MYSEKTKRMVGMGLFTAIVVVLQLVGSGIRLGPFSVSLVLVPIVVGAAMYGVGAGAWLGGVFGFAVLASGDAAAFWAVSVGGTAVTVMVKGVAAGLAAALVYRALEKWNLTAAVVAAAVLCPVVNTGIFLLGCRLFFMDTLALWASQLGFGSDVGRYMIFGLVGGNFIAELIMDAVLAPAVVRLIRVGKKS